MLSKLVLFASAGGLMRGYINLRSEKIFQQIFKDVEKMPIYNLDYLQSLQDIPTNKFILLCGKAIPHEQVTYPYHLLFILDNLYQILDKAYSCGQ